MTDAKFSVVDADQINVVKRKAPVTRILEELGDEYKTTRDVARICGVHIETIRRLIRPDADGNKKVNAPSKVAYIGNLYVYLFTEDDVREVVRYLNNRTIVDRK